MLALTSLIACSSDYLVVEDGGFEDEVVDEAWDSATLMVDSPTPGSFISWEDGGHFEARVVDAEGNSLEFEDIQWSSDIGGWENIGASFDDDTMDVGTHAITAMTTLPNGDRLAYTVGGVLIQSVYAGTYAGTMSVDMTYDTYTVGCAGASTIIIDAYGDQVDGDASCLLSFQGYDLDSAFVLDVENDRGVLYGTIAVEIYGYVLPMDFSGDVTEDGQFFGVFDGDMMGMGSFAGELDVVRVSRDTSYSSSE
ncbi:MAG TPA: hypothetical protein QGF58_20310 [Myxococcota bacterium]|nr:hypothetical protein [Myxococcota bacterium]